MAFLEYHVIASWLGSTLSYIASYLCTLSIANLVLALADIKAFILVAYICSYEAIVR